MQVNAHHLDKNNGLLTSHQNTCNFVPKLSYFNVVCSNLVIGFKTQFFYAQFFEYVFCNTSLDW